MYLFSRKPAVQVKQCYSLQWDQGSLSFLILLDLVVTENSYDHSRHPNLQEAKSSIQEVLSCYKQKKYFLCAAQLHSNSSTLAVEYLLLLCSSSCWEFLS